VSLGLLGQQYLDSQPLRASYQPAYTPTSLVPGTGYTLLITLGNTSRRTWQARGPSPVRLSYHWLDAGGKAVHWDGARTDLPRDLPPGQRVTLNARVVAPAQPGSYLLHWDLLQENVTWFSAREAGGPKLPLAVGVAAPLAAPAGGSLGPGLRVGVYSTTESTVHLSATGRFRLLGGEGGTLAYFGPQESVAVQRGPDGGLSVLGASGQPITPGRAARFAPDGPGLLQAVDLPEYNRFRGVLEVQFSPVSERLWVINELPTEEYLLGIGEEPESFPYAALKAAVVAYRSYALAAMRQRSGRSGQEPFHLVSQTAHVEPYTGANQWYVGHYRETLGPNLSRAVQETRGEVLTYEGQVALTPYFADADGRLRSFAEVWGSEGYPWLPGGEDPTCNGGELRGHGVGMCMAGAMRRARDGAPYDRILAFYYPGTALTKLY
jgi:hypothetical protein